MNLNQPSPLPVRSRTKECIEADRRFTLQLTLVALAAGVIGAVAFWMRPDFDILIAGIGFEDRKFLLEGNDFWWWVRRIAMAGFGVFYVLIVVGAIRSWLGRTEIGGLYPLEWLYLVFCSLAGPLLLTNVLLKDNVGRPRPRSITEFNGDLDFKAIFEAGGQCSGNCSFVSGEVSSMVMIFASTMFIAQSWRRYLFLAILPAWAFSAFLRIGTGAHFASDTFLAGIFMILVAASLYWIMFLGNRNGNA